jgi:predicted DNA-binding transcriptional regulator AlpA
MSADRTTWPEVLTLAEVADVLRLSVHTIRRRCADRTMVPAPARELGRPYRWRKADVLRVLDGRAA